MWSIFYATIFSVFFTVIIPLHDPFWRPKEGVFFVMSLLFIASCLFKPTDFRGNFQNRALAMLLSWVVLLFGWNFIIPRVFTYDEMTTWAVWTILPSLNTILAIILIFFLVEFTDTMNRWVQVVKILCLIASIYSLYAIFQWLGFDQLFTKVNFKYLLPQEEKTSHMFTFIGNKMFTANLIAMLTPLFLIFKQKRYYVGLGLCLLALLLTQSVINIIAATVGIFIVLSLQGKAKIGLIIIGLLVLYIVFFGKYTNFYRVITTRFSGRLPLCKELLSKWRHKWVTGYGLGAIPRFYAKGPDPSTWWISSHNVYIDILFETGVIGFGLVCYYFATLFSRIKKLFYQERQSSLLIGFIAGIISYSIICLSSFPHLIAPTALIGIIYIAGLEANLTERRRIYS